MKRLVVIILFLLIFGLGNYEFFSYDRDDIVNNEQVGKVENITQEDNKENVLVVEEQEDIIEEIKQEQEKIEINTPIIENSEIKIAKTEAVVNTTPKQEKKVEKTENDKKVVKQENNNSTTTQKKEEIVVKEEKQENKPSINETTKVETPKETMKNETTDNKVVTTIKSNCENGKHIAQVGNTNRWFKTQKEAIKVYEDELEKWESKLQSKKINYEEFSKNCPSGYEVWSCPYCEQWTINIY